MRGAFFQLPPVLFVRDMVQTYGRLGVSRAAASLAYFLILTLFPLLVCVNFFIGLLELDPEAVFSALDPLLPRESLSIILEYLTYVSGIPQSQSTPLLLASLFTILLSASAGLRTLLKTMDELYQIRHVSSLRRVAVSVILSLLFLLTIYLSIVVIFTGDWFFQVLEERLPPPLAELIPLRLLPAAVLLRAAAGAGGVPHGHAAPPPPGEKGPAPYRPPLRRGSGGLLGAVLLVHRHVLPVLPGVRLSGLSDHPAGVAVLLRKHPPGGGGGRAGVVPAAGWELICLQSRIFLEKQENSLDIFPKSYIIAKPVSRYKRAHPLLPAVPGAIRP